MRTTHTLEPWFFDDLEMKIKGSGDIEGRTVIANVSSRMDYSRGMNTQCANAERIVDCVNAMEGIQNPKNLRETWEAVKHLELDKYHNLKEVIQNMIDRLDEGSEMTLTKDSIIVHCLKEAIK